MRMKKLMALAVVAALAGCATVRQQDLDAWVGAPVAALDTHRLFLTLPMRKTIADDGTEVRVYSNTVQAGSCFAGASASGQTTVNAAGWSNCVSSVRGCHNIFYIRDGRITEYAPTGQCYTDESVRPGKRWRNG